MSGRNVDDGEQLLRIFQADLSVVKSDVKAMVDLLESMINGDGSDLASANPSSTS